MGSFDTMAKKDVADIVSSSSSNFSEIFCPIIKTCLLIVKHIWNSFSDSAILTSISTGQISVNLAQCSREKIPKILQYNFNNYVAYFSLRIKQS